jgi:nucleotide-binding universal stress UspA family protein
MTPNILVAFDFSDSAERALVWAADLQRSTGGGSIHMVHAINSRPLGAAERALEPVLPGEGEIAGLERTMGEAARACGAEAKVTVVMAPSAVGDTILDVARSGGVELIVMGTHGRTGVRRLFLGSIAEHVLRHADCPVVIVRGPRGK